MPVWHGARKAITVNATRSLRLRLEATHDDVSHLTPDSRGILERARAYLKTLRPHQWIKNLLIAVPVLTAHKFDVGTLLAVLIAFIAFTLIASGAYILNDFLDLESDRAHPRKKERPFAAGSVPIKHGLIALPILILSAIGLSAWVLPWQFMAVMAVYCVLTAGYSLYFKQRLVVDVICLAMLYTVRIVAGSAATGISLSPWLLAFSIFLFLSLAIMKRLAELEDARRSDRQAIMGRSYNPSDQPILQSMAVSSGYLAVLVLALYINSENVTHLYKSPSLLWGICPLMLFWINRLLMKTHRGMMHDDPVVFVATDLISIFTMFLIAAVMVAASVL